MDHFGGITPQERFNNDLLNELRKINKKMETLIGHNAQMSEQKTVSKNATRGTVK